MLPVLLPDTQQLPTAAHLYPMRYRGSSLVPVSADFSHSQDSLSRCLQQIVIIFVQWHGCSPATYYDLNLLTEPILHSSACGAAMAGNLANLSLECSLLCATQCLTVQQSSCDSVCCQCSIAHQHCLLTLTTPAQCCRDCQVDCAAARI